MGEPFSDEAGRFVEIARAEYFSINPYISARPPPISMNIASAHLEAEGDYRQLMGACYIPGYMNGEAMPR